MGRKKSAGSSESYVVVKTRWAAEVCLSRRSCVPKGIPLTALHSLANALSRWGRTRKAAIISTNPQAQAKAQNISALDTDALGGRDRAGRDRGGDGMVA